ncbi:FHA domain-containing protein [Alishewanella tabrizica]|uniref:FHA domain-containing protein n=1 Tax=Alishewanella tabrizica TaxID=671278 RepID=A0ABQ2WQP1_9ALTE|nr:FHA domain-containing protein [Alishewanella tabrizica]GGW67564.1 hypothetical protein GCM10008111_24520 [Alishewanella tabrizica]
MAIIVELLNSQGKPVSIHKFTQSDIRIGRSYENDVIVQDPYCCAEHAVLSCNDQGHWHMRDLASVNGTVNSQGQRIDFMSIAANGQEFMLGQQRLRVLLSDAAIAPTRIIAQGWHSLRILSSLPLLVLVLLIVALDMAYGTWIDVLGEAAEKWQRQLLVIPFFLLIPLLWPALLALFARFRGQDAHFRQQAALVYAVVAAWVLWDIMANWLGFNFSDSTLFGVLQKVVPTMLLLSLFWYGFSLVAIQRKSVQAILTLALASTYWLFPYIQSAGPNIQPRYEANLLPQAFLVTSPSNSTDFMAASQSLYQQVTLVDHIAVAPLDNSAPENRTSENSVSDNSTVENSTAEKSVSKEGV